MRTAFVTKAAFVILVVWAIGVLGRWDIEEERRQARHYEEMVCAGAWPDYDNREPECQE